MVIYWLVYCIFIIKTSRYHQDATINTMKKTLTWQALLALSFLLIVLQIPAIAQVTTISPQVRGNEEAIPIEATTIACDDMGGCQSATEVSYQYGTSNNRLLSVDNGQELLYDANGNLVADGQRAFVWDEDGRLSAISENNTALGQYSYDFQGLRRSATRNGITTLFIYDNNGNVLAEVDEDGNILREYAYLDGQRLALFELDAVDGNAASSLEEERIFYYINDHLGTAQLLLDEQAVVVWQGNYQPFGEVDVVVNDLEQHFRFPGQIFDTESGLHYNWNRYYNPETGRYISPDPIGLDGGLNLYAYVGNDPVNWMDLEGLYSADLIVKPGDSTFVGKIKVCLQGLCSEKELKGLIELAKIAGDAAAVTLGTSYLVDSLAKNNNCPPSNDYCNQLNAVVQNAKKAAESLGKCKPWMSYYQLSLRKNTWLALAQARTIRDVKCWGGGRFWTPKSPSSGVEDCISMSRTDEEINSIIKIIELSFSYRKKPELSVYGNTDKYEKDEILTIFKYEWKDITCDILKDTPDVFYLIDPDAFCYYIPSVLCSSIRENNYDLYILDCIIQMLDRDEDDNLWIDFFKDRWLNFTEEEIDSIINWFLFVEPMLFIDTISSERIYKCLNRILFLIKQKNIIY